MLPNISPPKITAANREEILLRSQRANRDITQTDMLEKLHTLTDEETFRMAYLPLLVAEVIWDYADTIIDLATLQDDPATKKLSRTVRKLRSDYIRLRGRFLSDDQLKKDECKMEQLQDDFAARSNAIAIFLRLELNLQFSRISERSLDLLLAVHMALIWYGALGIYVQSTTEMFVERFGPGNYDVLPSQLAKLKILLPEFAGDCLLPSGYGDIPLWMQIIANDLKRIEPEFDK